MYPSRKSYPQLHAGFERNAPEAADNLVRVHGHAALLARHFMTKLRRYLRGQRNGAAVYKLVCDLMGMCAHASISSLQLASGIKGALRNHPKALNAINPLLARIHQLVNLVRFHTALTSADDADLPWSAVHAS